MESPRGNILTVDWDHTGRIEALRMTMRGYELLCDGESRILTAEAGDSQEAPRTLTMFFLMGEDGILRARG